MPTPTADPLRDASLPRLEPREVSPVTHLVATGLGSMAGNLLAVGMRMGLVGRALASIAGAVVGHFVVTNRVVFGEQPDTTGPVSAPPPSPMAYSDRR